MTDTQPGVGRRPVIKGAAWSVPVLAVGAPAPAFAVSTTAATLTARCGVGPLAFFDLDVSAAPPGSDVRLTLTRSSGSGTFTAVAPAGWTLESQTGTTRVYLVPTTAGSASGTVTVAFQLGQNGTATITGAVSVTPGPVDGDLTSSVFKRRDGNSQNYQCLAT
jgi:hypothetical protein